VRNGRWFCSVHTGAGSRASAEQKFIQVTEASSSTPRDVQDGSLSPDTTKDAPYELHRLNGKEGIPTKRFYPGINHESHHGSSTKRICQHKVTCEIRRCIDTWWWSHIHTDKIALVTQKVVDIQTAHGATLMSTTHRCLKTYYIRDRLGKIRPSSFVVLAYVIPGLIHDLLSFKELNQSGYRVIHDADEEESGVFAVINKKIDESSSFPFLGEHSKKNPQIVTDECNPSRKAIMIRAMAPKTGKQLKQKYSRLTQMEFRTGRLEKADL
jgi:hypothetical protein